MATDGPTPAPCAQDVFKNGFAVFFTHTIPSNAMEGWVKSVQELSNLEKNPDDEKNRIDWHFSGGRAVVKALGDREEVYEAIAVMMPEHDRLFVEAHNGELLGKIYYPRPNWWESRPMHVKVLDRLMGSVVDVV